MDKEVDEIIVVAEVDKLVDLVGEEEELADTEEVVERAARDQLITIPWLATVVGCVAISPVTVPKRPSHKEVVLLALPIGNRLNLCIEAQEAEDVVVDKSDSVASAFCMMTGVTNTPSMMQDSCMCH